MREKKVNGTVRTTGSGGEMREQKQTRLRKTPTGDTDSGKQQTSDEEEGRFMEGR